jgi:hypothetical protein
MCSGTGGEGGTVAAGGDDLSGKSRGEKGSESDNNYELACIKEQEERGELWPQVGTI